MAVSRRTLAGDLLQDLTGTDPLDSFAMSGNVEKLSPTGDVRTAVHAIARFQKELVGGLGLTKCSNSACGHEQHALVFCTAHKVLQQQRMILIHTYFAIYLRTDLAVMGRLIISQNTTARLVSLSSGLFRTVDLC